MGRISDAQLMSASIEDPTQFGEIFDRHAATMLRFLVRRCEREVGENLIGELFRIAFERRASFDCGRESARPWLYGIASNLILKQRRSEARRLRATAKLAALDESVFSSEVSTHRGLDERRLLQRVADAIEALPDAEREALLLFVWEELSYADIAAALDVPVGTVRSRIHRARSRLRELDYSSGKYLQESAKRDSRRNILE